MGPRSRARASRTRSRHCLRCRRRGPSSCSPVPWDREPSSSAWPSAARRHWRTAWWHMRNGVVDPYQGRLLYQPIGYANAVGILAAMVLVLTLGLLLEQRGRARQAALAIAVCLSLVVLWLSHSRGAWLAGLVGLTTMAVRLRVSRRRALPLWVGLVALSVVALLVLPLLVEPAQPARRSAIAPTTGRSHGTHSTLPSAGLGSGAFAQLWAIERPVGVNAIDAHSPLPRVAPRAGRRRARLCRRDPVRPAGRRGAPERRLGRRRDRRLRRLSDARSRGLGLGDARRHDRGAGMRRGPRGRAAGARSSL